MKTTQPSWDALTDRPVRLLVARGIGWRAEVSADQRMFFLILGKSEVRSVTVPDNVRVKLVNVDGENFRRMYVFGKTNEATAQAAANLMALAPYNPYNGQGMRTFEQSKKPLKATKKAK